MSDNLESSLKRLRWARLLINANAFGPLMPIYMKGAHFSPIEFLRLAALIKITSLLFDIPTGKFAERYGNKLSMAVGGLIMATGQAAFCFNPGKPWLAAAAIAMSVGACFFFGAETDLAGHLCVNHYGADWSQKYALYTGRTTQLGGLSEAGAALVASGIVLIWGVKAVAILQAVIEISLFITICTIRSPSQNQIPPPSREELLSAIGNLTFEVTLEYLYKHKRMLLLLLYALYDGPLRVGRQEAGRLFKLGLAEYEPAIDQGRYVTAMLTQSTRENLGKIIRRQGNIAKARRKHRLRIVALIVAWGTMAGLTTIAYRMAPLYYETISIDGHHLATAGFALLWSACLASIWAFGILCRFTVNLPERQMLLALGILAAIGGAAYVLMAATTSPWGLLALPCLFLMRANDAPLLTKQLNRLMQMRRRATMSSINRTAQEVISSASILAASWVTGIWGLPASLAAIGISHGFVALLAIGLLIKLSAQ